MENNYPNCPILQVIAIGLWAVVVTAVWQDISRSAVQEDVKQNVLREETRNFEILENHVEDLGKSYVFDIPTYKLFSFLAANESKESEIREKLLRQAGHEMQNFLVGTRNAVIVSKNKLPYSSDMWNTGVFCFDGKEQTFNKMVDTLCIKKELDPIRYWTYHPEVVVMSDINFFKKLYLFQDSEEPYSTPYSEEKVNIPFIKGNVKAEHISEGCELINFHGEKFFICFADKIDWDALKDSSRFGEPRIVEIHLPVLDIDSQFNIGDVVGIPVENIGGVTTSTLKLDRVKSKKLDKYAVVDATSKNKEEFVLNRPFLIIAEDATWMASVVSPSKDFNEIFNRID